MIHLILIRHGRRLGRHNGHDDPLDPLALCVRDEVRARAQDLNWLCSRPSQILTSRHRHARETAGILAKELRLSSRAGPKDAPFLTPQVKAHPWYYRSPQADPCTICDDQRKSPSSLPWHKQAEAALRAAVAAHGISAVLVWVGHETRLSQLVLQFTGQRSRQLEALDAVCLTGADATSFIQGTASVAWRYPVRNWLEAEIKPKLESKMTVATLLASANFVAMFEILINKPAVLTLTKLEAEGMGSPWFPPLLSKLIEGSYPCLTKDIVTGCMQALAFLCFSVAAALFVCTVYLYDRLAMPDGFWTLTPPREAKRRSADARERDALHGAPYLHMVRIWRSVFTPAVRFSFFGAFTLVLSLGRSYVVGLFVALFLLAYYWYRRFRPSKNVD